MPESELLNPQRQTPNTRGLVREIPDLPRRSRAAAYAIAAGLSAVALALTVLFLPWLERSVFLLFWPAVFAAAWLGGFGPAALTAVLAVVMVDIVVIPPPMSLRTTDPRDIVGLLGFLLVSGPSAWAVARLQRAKSATAEAAQVNANLAKLLDEQGEELAQQLEEAQSMQEELEASTEELAERTAEAESADRFTRGILESISDPFVVYDAEWRFRYINAAAARIFESNSAGPVHYTGSVVWEIWPELIGTKTEREMRRAATEMVPTTFEAFAPANGTWAELYCYPLPDGGLGVQWKDITQRKRIEESTRYLSRASELLASSLDYEQTLSEVARLIVPEFADWCSVSILDDGGEPRQLALAHVDPDKVKWAIELNKRYPPDKRADTGVPQVIRSGKPEIYPDIPDELLVAGAIDDEHLRITRELGLRSAMIVPLSTSDTILGAITIVSAESGRRYTDQDLEFAMELARRAALAVDNAVHHKAELEARQAAEGANAAKTQFLAVMSHELRTPLNAIGGYTELLLMGLRGPLTADQTADLERIQRSQRNLLSLINDILNYAKLDAGRVEFSMSVVPLHPLLLELEPLITPQLRSRKLSYEYTGCDETLAAWADREKVRQVLLNLLSNAIKFTDAGGRITIDCSADDDEARVLVSDTGFGIPEDKLGSIFEPFVQLERNLSSTHEGTGLGLAISRDLARGMGGELTVESKVGDGSIFVLTLRRERMADLEPAR
ncbi:MAG TPA: ATP-binding protein, partial [Gemmatimonadaceae bacterium]|nr:ATP-binding protein [Gemmatimonadaceae bacterium]